jgi:hypothetical protein
MQMRPAHASKAMWSLSKCTLLTSILFAFGCANELNLIPEGYKDLVRKHKDIAQMAAGLDFPVVINVEPDAQEFPVVFTKYGRSVKKPFWKTVADYQFALIASGVSDALCSTAGWTPAGDGDFGQITCRRVRTADYIGVPLVAMLEFRFEGEEKIHTVERVYYFVHKR